MLEAAMPSISAGYLVCREQSRYPAVADELAHFAPDRGLDGAAVHCALPQLLRCEVHSTALLSYESSRGTVVARAFRRKLRWSLGLPALRFLRGGVPRNRAMTMPVTVDNFIRAETDTYFAGFVQQGALGQFLHHRDLPLEDAGVRPNRDTLYSLAVFDLDAGPVTIALPDAGSRFMSLMVLMKTTTSLRWSMPQGTTPTPRSGSAPAICLSRSAPWLTQPIRTTSTSPTPCKTRSRCSKRVG